jgi:cyclopropane-fatty-acyl-phospholipid synthase
MTGKRHTLLRERLESVFVDFPYRVRITDWIGGEFVLGKEAEHWAQDVLRVHIKTAAAGKAAVDLDGLRFLERFRNGEIDLTGNLYVLAELRNHAGLSLSCWQLLRQVLRARLLQFQDMRRARENVKTHYDIPQQAVNVYLDRVYQAYSCAMFEDPHKFDVAAMTTPGSGRSDTFDSLKKAQWRKFKDAVDFLEPHKGETLLDVGCGYGGQLAVALESASFDKVVGWTLSTNQVQEGKKFLSEFAPERWELNEGDYREDDRVFDHITSTGMISHVGPRGLVPYVRNIRRRIRSGGRYVHHAIMSPYLHSPLDAEIGIAFNKMYVWPGFHWFTVGQHVRALEQNGFAVVKAVNLAPHYAKTVAAWYERMMVNAEQMKKYLGERGFRAWQIYLSGGSQGLLNGRGHVYRIYCRAV